MKRFLLAIALALMSLPASAGIDEQFDACTRITASNSIGTGAVYGMMPDYTAILTNQHVVGSEKSVTCEFWSRGHQSGKLPGQVLVADSSIDAALVLVPTAAFGGVFPKPLSWAASNPPVGALVRSVGCANGSWATAWQGHVTRYEGGQMFFVPPPAGGRSGSAICNEAGQIVGLLRIRTGDGEGGAVDLPTLLSKIAPAAKVNFNTFRPDRELAAYVQCPGGNCPGGSCPTPQYDDGFGLRRPILPLRPTPAPPISGSSAWPTLPAPTPAPGPAPTDLSPVIDAIGKLQVSIESQKAAPPCAPAIPAAPSGPDAQTTQALSQHAVALDSLTSGQKQLGSAVDQLNANQKQIVGQVDQLRTDVPKIVATAVKPLEDQVAKIDKAVKPLEDIDAKLEALKAKGGLVGKVAGDIENATQGDDKALRQVLITGGIILGVALLVIFGVLHLKNTGKGLLGDALDKLAARHPDNQFLQKAATTVDNIDAKIAAALPHAVASAVSGHPAVAAATTAAAVASGAVQSLQAQIAQQAATLANVALNTPSPAQAATTPATPVAPAVVNVTTAPAASPAVAA